MALKSGDSVTANVRLIEPLAYGAMGHVWLAEHTTLETEVAVKLLADWHFKRDPSALERFRREAAATAKIKSPHVVEVFDYGALPEGIPFIVMELLEGETLAERLSRVRVLSPRELAPIFVQLADGLDAAHRQGIVHRDLKPSNIFLCKQTRGVHVKLFDFGIAKALTRADWTKLTRPGTQLGTPAFMSLEQFLNADKVDHLVDLWAAAVVAYQALTGELPFEAEDSVDLALEILDCHPRRPSEVRPELPAVLDGWFARALSASADERFETAVAMADAFAAAVRTAEEPAERSATADPPTDEELAGRSEADTDPPPGFAEADTDPPPAFSAEADTDPPPALEERRDQRSGGGGPARRAAAGAAAESATPREGVEVPARDSLPVAPPPGSDPAAARRDDAPAPRWPVSAIVSVVGALALAAGTLIALLVPVADDSTGDAAPKLPPAGSPAASQPAAAVSGAQPSAGRAAEAASSAAASTGSAAEPASSAAASSAAASSAAASARPPLILPPPSAKTGSTPAQSPVTAPAPSPAKTTTTKPQLKDLTFDD